MARLDLSLAPMLLLVATFITPNFSEHSGHDRPRRSHGSGNAIFQQLLESAGDQVIRQRPANALGELDDHALDPLPDRDVSRRLANLEANVEQLLKQNDLLRQQLAVSESRSQRLGALVEKLEQIFGGDVNENVVKGNVRDENGHADSGGKYDEEQMRINSLLEYLGNREAELVAYSPGHYLTLNQTSTVDDLREELSNGARKTLDLLGRSLVQLSEKADLIENDVRSIQSQMEQRGAANSIAAAVPRRSSTIKTSAEQPLANITELDASRKVAFSVAATRSQYGTTGGPQVVQFQDVMENKGGYYLASNYTFLCAVPGWYYFTVSLRTVDNKYLGVLMMKNDDYLVGVSTDASTRNTMESQSTIVELQAGDAVWLRLAPGEKYAIFSDSYRYSTFSGYLLFKS
ncbi:uncharacterized protein [Diadema antillarum]|uniref:uncharacterized protein n=1 Tax=Diadema antillarum TaxID=105358 RepID=UPI003A88F8AA